MVGFGGYLHKLATSNRYLNKVRVVVVVVVVVVVLVVLVVKSVVSQLVEIVARIRGPSHP